ncbi:hypothetical protein Q7P37_007620 [Cladosporium fusiforme]
MDSQIVMASHPLRTDLLVQIANSGVLDEISNHPGAVRHYIYHHGRLPRKASNPSRRPLLFAIYQTGRYGPQNGFRLCVVQRDFCITSPTKSESDIEDDIDRLELGIPQGHVEVAILS